MMNETSLRTRSEGRSEMKGVGRIAFDIGGRALLGLGQGVANMGLPGLALEDAPIAVACDQRRLIGGRFLFRLLGSLGVGAGRAGDHEAASNE
jgi:hypothetical protein